MMLTAKKRLKRHRTVGRVITSSLWLAAGGLGLVAFGKGATMSQAFSATSSPTIYTTPVWAENTPPRWSTSQPPQLVFNHGAPLILTTTKHQLVLFHRVQNHWQRHLVATVATPHTIDGARLWCGPRGCWMALTTTSPGHASARLRIVHRNASAWHWKTRYRAGVSANATGGLLQIIGNGSTLWVLSTGTPAGGIMPKRLWSSPNGGRSWSLIATSKALSRSTTLHLPTGYPTGMTALSQNHFILTLQAPNTSLTALSYTLHPRAVHLLPFPTPKNIQWEAALPALVDGSTVTIPLMGLSQGAKNGVVMLATRKSSHSVWTLHPLAALPGGSATTASGTMDVLSGTTHLDIFWPSGHVIQLPELTSFPTPLVTAQMGSHLVVLGKNKSLWVNSHKGWRKWS